MIMKLSRHRLGLAIMALLAVPYHAFATDPVSLQQHALAVTSWPDQVRPPSGSPNVLIIMSDDVGYGSARSFGGRIPTPTFDEVGETGLRYTHFMTAAVCSPTRASLLTGRLPQEVGIGYPTNWPTPYPGYRQRLVAVSAQTMALIDEGWMVAATPTSSPWGRTGQEGVVPTERRWELYDLGRDFNQRHDLAAEHPERVHALTTLFWQEAERARMLPIHTHEGAQQEMPGERAPGEVLRFTRPVAGIPGSAAPRVVGRSWRLSADVETSAHSGVLVAHGGRYAGYALFLHERRIHFSYRLNPQTGWYFACPLPESAQRVSTFVEIRMETLQPGSAASVRLGICGQFWAGSGDSHCERPPSGQLLAGRISLAEPV